MLLKNNPIMVSLICFPTVYTCMYEEDDVDDNNDNDDYNDDVEDMEEEKEPGQILIRRSAEHNIDGEFR